MLLFSISFNQIHQLIMSIRLLIHSYLIVIMLKHAIAHLQDLNFFKVRIRIVSQQGNYGYETEKKSYFFVVLKLHIL